MSYLRMSELDLADKRVLIRQDLNVPFEGGRVSSDARLEASIPTLEMALDAGAKVRVMSHLGRPKEGQPDEVHSLMPVAQRLSELMGREIPLVRDWIDGADTEVDLLLLENTRFLIGEKANDRDLSQKMAALCDIFVMDAFGTAHRKQASTYGVAEFAPVSCAGPLLARELDALGMALRDPARPMVVIVGGSKVSTKLELLQNLSHVADQLVLGGGIANTFLAANGDPIGASLHEADLIPAARMIYREVRDAGGEIPLPVDVITATEISPEAHPEVRPIQEVEDDEKIADVGPRTIAALSKMIHKAGTVVWNGPLGVFEIDLFGSGTEALALAIAECDAFTIAGGGDTLAAIEKYGVQDDISYISTGGGAFLEFLEGKTLPAVEILERRASE